jgi:hypothetical protein
LSPTAPFPFNAPLLLLEVFPENFDGAQGECRLLFDTTPAHPLADLSGADPAKWTVSVGGVLYQGNALNAEGFDEVLLEVLRTADDDVPDAISYANNPSDISDTRGRKLAAFADRPL